MKKIRFILVLIILFLPFTAKAEGNVLLNRFQANSSTQMVFEGLQGNKPMETMQKETYNLTLPSNNMNEIDMLNVMTDFDFKITQWIVQNYSRTEGATEIITNQAGKDVIKYTVYGVEDFSEITEETAKDLVASFEILPNVTKDDLTYQITNNTSGLSSDIRNRYDQVVVSLKEMEIDHLEDALIVDFTKYNSFMELPYLQTIAVERAAYFLNPKEIEVISNPSGKELLRVSIKFIEDQSPTIIEHPEGLTSEDDIIINLNDELRTRLLQSLDSPNQYNRIVLNFSNSEYLNNDDYVIRFNNMEDMPGFEETIFYCMEEGLLKFDVYTNLYNSEDKLLLSILFEELNEYNSVFIIGDDVTYKDNVTLVDDEILEDINDHHMASFNRIIFKFANPTFTYGANQEYVKANNEKLHFGLNIRKDKLLENGKVYVDGQLVDKNQYTIIGTDQIEIEFKDNFAKELAEGEHEFTVEVIDGNATTTFKVMNYKIINPSTGNRTILFILFILFCLVTGTFYTKKKESNH